MILTIATLMCTLSAPVINVQRSGGLNSPAIYSYVVEAVAKNQSSTPSNTATILLSLPNINQPNVISWSPVVGASKYKVYRTQDTGSIYVGLLGTTKSTSFNDYGQVTQRLGAKPKC